MCKEVIFTEKTPTPRGTYSQGVKTPHFIFLSGQLPIQQESGELIIDSPEEMFRQCFKNLKFLCEEAGEGINSIVKMTVYLTKKSYSPFLDMVMPEFFIIPYPARTRIFVANLSMNAKIEIDAIATVSRPIY